MSRTAQSNKATPQKLLTHLQSSYFTVQIDAAQSNTTEATMKQAGCRITTAEVQKQGVLILL